MNICNDTDTCIREALENENAQLKRVIAERYVYITLQQRIKQLRDALQLSDDMNMRWSGQHAIGVETALSFPDNTAELDSLIQDASRFRFEQERALKGVPEYTVANDFLNDNDPGDGKFKERRATFIDAAMKKEIKK